MRFYQLLVFITAKLTTLFNFQPTSHEPALSQAIINEHKIFLARQVDDFRFASADLSTLEQIITTLQSNCVRIRIVDQSTFNSVDVTEFKDTVKVHAISNITKMEKKIGHHLQNVKLPKQICTDPQLRSMTTDRLVLSDKETKELEVKFGFKYRTAAGMILFTCVLYRLDIGFLAIILSKYNHQLNEIHFEVAAQVLLYLIRTKDKGINYHRVTPKANLPPCPDLHPPEPHDVPFPATSSILQPIGTVDASFAPDIEQRK